MWLRRYKNVAVGLLKLGVEAAAATATATATTATTATGETRGFVCKADEEVKQGRSRDIFVSRI